MGGSSHDRLPSPLRGRAPHCCVRIGGLTNLGFTINLYTAVSMRMNSIYRQPFTQNGKTLFTIELLDNDGTYGWVVSNSSNEPLLSFPDGIESEELALAGGRNAARHMLLAELELLA